MGDEQRSITSLKTTAKEWARKVGIDSIDRLNEMIDSGKGLELILVCEAMQSNCMYEIARKVPGRARRARQHFPTDSVSSFVPWDSDHMR